MHYVALINSTGGLIELNKAGVTFWRTQDFNLQSPDLSIDEVKASFLDGGEVAMSRLPNAENELTLTISGPTSDQLRVNIRVLEQWRAQLSDAQRTKSGQRFYIVWRSEGDTTTWRSELLSMRLEYNKGALSVGWPNLAVEAVLSITRRYYWESTVELEAKGATVDDPNIAIGGRRIYNNGLQNRFHINPDVIGGNLPTPAILSLKVLDASRTFRNFYIGNNALEASTKPYSVVHHLEGTATVNQDLGDSVVSIGTATSGSVLRKSFTGTDAFKWWIDPNTLYPRTNQQFRLFARFSDYSTANQIWVTPKLQDYYNQYDLWVGKEIPLPNPRRELVDLGTAILCPIRNYATSGLGKTVLSLEVRCNAAANVDLDFVDLLNADNLRQMTQIGGTLYAASYIIDNPVDDQIYNLISDLGTPLRHFMYTTYNGPVYLLPGFHNRLVVLEDQDTASNIRDGFLMQVSYRARVLTV